MCVILLCFCNFYRKPEISRIDLREDLTLSHVFAFSRSHKDDFSGNEESQSGRRIGRDDRTAYKYRLVILTMVHIPDCNWNRVNLRCRLCPGEQEATKTQIENIEKETLRTAE